MKETIEQRSGINKDVFSPEIVDTFFGSSTSVKEPAVEKKEPKKTSFTIKGILKIIISKKYLRWFVFLVGAIIITSIVSYKFSYYQYMASYTEGSFLPDPFKRSYDLELINSDMFNRNVIKKIYFNDDASGQSMFLRNSLRMVNSQKTGQAKVVIELSRKIDFQNKYFELIAKTQDFPKSLYLTVTDESDNTLKMPLIISPKWETYKVQIPYDPEVSYTNIKNISFDFGRSQTGNTDDSTFFIKKMNIRSKTEY